MANVELMEVVVAELLWSVAVEFWGVAMEQLLELELLRTAPGAHCPLLNLELVVKVVM